MADLDGGIRFIKGIGEKKAKDLSRLGINTLRDLLGYFPRDYEDRTSVKRIARVEEGERVCILASVVTSPSLARIRRGLDIVKFRVSDGTGSATVTFFNQSWLKDKFRPGEDYYFYGKFTRNGPYLSLPSPEYEKFGAEGSETGAIVPIYRLTSGVGNKFLLSVIRQGLEAAPDPFPEVIPESVRRAFDLPHAGWSYREIHRPTDMESVASARRRFVFEELFVLATAFGMMKRRERDYSGHVIPPKNVDDFRLPFSLTGAQKRAAGELMADMGSGRVMTRLLQGDVGSGKTAVAAICVWAVCAEGLQAAFMAPTEILAEQHFRTLSDMLAPYGITTVLITGSMKAAERREALAKIASGEAGLVVGTHAIISDNVEFSDLALVITDEQHRFGVRQRAALSEKGDKPHVLVMSATPIPRTLALIIYGDLDVSILNEIPSGRQKVDTFVVGEDMRERINNFIRKQVEEGHQVFIVCPMIEDDETQNAAAVKKYAEELKAEVFPDLRVDLLHGKMKAAEKDAVMARFAGGESDILVSTTVVEVGVDVPNATLMVVENAEHFGLSQLHQLRGRVGRGKAKSYCVLFNQGGAEAEERLDVLKNTNDGFKISSEDLRLRGPGDFFGSRQHGLPEMRLADLRGDMETLSAAQKQAELVLRDDPELALPEHAELRRRVQALQSVSLS